MIHFGTPAYTELFRSETTNDMHAQVERSGHSYFLAEGRATSGAFWNPSPHYEATKISATSRSRRQHDISRLRGARTRGGMKVIYAFLLTLPGIPFIYQGDEIGQYNVDGLPSKEGGYVRTGARTPIQWDDSANAGFSTAPANGFISRSIPIPRAPRFPHRMAIPIPCCRPSAASPVCVASIRRSRERAILSQSWPRTVVIHLFIGDHVTARACWLRSTHPADGRGGGERHHAWQSARRTGARIEKRAGAVTLVMAPVSFAIWEEA